MFTFLVQICNSVSKIYLLVYSFTFHNWMECRIEKTLFKVTFLHKFLLNIIKFVAKTIKVILETRHWIFLCCSFLQSAARKRNNTALRFSSRENICQADSLATSQKYIKFINSAQKSYKAELFLFHFKIYD